LVVGISGASGAVYGIRLLEVLKGKGVETHLVITPWGEEMIRVETEMSPEDVKNLATIVYDDKDMAARVSSGSFQFDGMIVIPCSMKTVSAIANGYASTLLVRAADVTLKEGRKLVIVPRETPVNQVHLKNLLQLAQMGVTVLPAMPGFYHRPNSMSDLVDHVVGKVLDQFSIEHNLYRRWQPLRDQRHLADQKNY
jgi:4-hydroxy-3-polyprenylbenzoate decarboxylase